MEHEKYADDMVEILDQQEAYEKMQESIQNGEDNEDLESENTLRKRNKNYDDDEESPEYDREALDQVPDEPVLKGSSAFDLAALDDTNSYHYSQSLSFLPSTRLSARSNITSVSNSTFKTANNLEFEDAQEYVDGQNDPDTKDWQAVDLKSKSKEIKSHFE